MVNKLRTLLVKRLVKYLIEDYTLSTIKLSDIKNVAVNRWTAKQLLLKKEISECKYKIIDRKYPTISKDNVLMDGNHRVLSLLEHYGSDYEIIVYKSIHSNWYRIWLIFFTIILYGSIKNNELKEDIKIVSGDRKEFMLGVSV